MSAVEYDVLNNLLIQFQNILFKNITPLKLFALSIFGGLVAVDLILAVLLNLGDMDHIKTLIVKTIKYTGLYWVILNYTTVIKVVLQGFIWIGITGGSSNSLQLCEVFNPTSFTELAVKIVIGILMKAGIMTNPLLGPTYMVIGILIFLALLMIAINFFITYIEFWALSILSLALLPFGANKYTSWAAQKIGNMLFSFGIKIMVLSFIAAVAIPIFENWFLPQNFNIQTMLYMFAGSLGLAFLSWHAPSMASTLMSGMPTLHAGHVVQPVIGAVRTVGTGMVTGGTSLSTQIAQGVSKGLTAVRSAANLSGGDRGNAVQEAAKPQLLNRYGKPFS